MAQPETTPDPVPSPAVAPPAAAKPPEANPASPPAAQHGGRSWLKWIVILAILVALGIAAKPWIEKSFSTVSTDDAYVNGHVTFVASRVAGQVARVLVDDNNRVHRGDLLVQLDREPFQVQLDIAQAAVEAAQSDLVVAQAQARGILGQIRSYRFNLEHAIEDVDNQLALLRSKVATLESQKVIATKTKTDYERVLPLIKAGAVTMEEVDHRRQAAQVAEAQVEEALQGVYQIRVSLGQPPKPVSGDDLTQVPPNLNQTFSQVRQAQASLMQAAAQIGVSDSFNKTPKEMVDDFYKRDPSGDIDKIFAELLKNAPSIKQAEAKVAIAQRNLDEAKLNLKYCDVVAEIDGVVTRRNVNPGNNVVVGQELMAVRSLTEIWIDANFKETQLADLRIGQSVDLDIDMYGSRQQFAGRISGFTMGTGSTLALLPAENATGNYVKVVQRLPVRIEVLNYDPDKVPLFIGLSVTPTVKIKEPPSGPNAGQLLQPLAPPSKAEAHP